MTCSRCDHFTMKAAAEASVEPCKTDRSSVGICRRYPPRMVRQSDGFFQSVFPNVHMAHGCGEYARSPAVAI